MSFDAYELLQSPLRYFYQDRVAVALCLKYWVAVSYFAYYSLSWSWQSSGHMDLQRIQLVERREAWLT